MANYPTPTLGFQNYYSTTLAQALVASDTTIYLNSLPTPSEGYLVIEPDSSTTREIIYYTSKGANFVTCPSAASGRGVGGTTAAAHSSGVTVQMNDVAELFLAVQSYEANTGLQTYFNESLADYVLSGGAISSATGLIGSISSGTVYINGRRLALSAASKTFTASKDTYVDIQSGSADNIATVVFTELASGATGSTPASNSIHLGMVNTGASTIGTVRQSGADVLLNPYKNTSAVPIGGVLPHQLQSGTGTSWAMQSWTPTLSGQFTNGDWTKACKYIQIGKLVFYQLILTSADATPMAGGTGQATFTLPVTSVAVPIGLDNTIIGHGLIGDASTAIYPCFAAHTSTTTASIYATDDAAGGVRELGVSATSPMTWTTSDTITVTGFYEAA